MDIKYTIIATMCALFLNCVGFDAHHVTLTEGEIAAVEEAEDHRALRQAAEAHAEGLRAEEAKWEVIDELRRAGNLHETVAVRAMSGEIVGHIDPQGMLTLEDGQRLIIWQGMVTIVTENGLKLAKIFLPRTPAAINDLSQIIHNGEFITPEVSVVLSDIPAYGTIPTVEMLEILLLLQINNFRPCQRFVEGYPKLGVFDDSHLIECCKREWEALRIVRLIAEAAEIAYQYKRSISIREGFITFRLFTGITNDQKHEYIENLKRIDAFRTDNRPMANLILFLS